MVPAQNFANFTAAGQIAQQGATDTNSLLSTIINNSLAREQAERESQRAAQLELAKLNQDKLLNFLNTKTASEQFDRDLGFRNKSLSSSVAEGQANRNVQLYGLDKDSADKLQYQDFLSGENALDRQAKERENFISAILGNRKLDQEEGQFGRSLEVTKRGQDLDYAGRLATIEGKDDKELNQILQSIQTDELTFRELNEIPDAKQREFAGKIMFSRYINSMQSELSEKLKSGQGLSIGEVNGLIEKYLSEDAIKDMPTEFLPVIQSIKEKLQLQLSKPASAFRNISPFPNTLEKAGNNIYGALTGISASIFPDQKTFDDVDPELVNILDQIRKSYLPGNELVR